MKIAVTGGAGHVGTAVCKLALAQGHNVVAIDRAKEGRIQPSDRYEYKAVDLLDLQAYKAAVEGCDGIVHLAALLYAPGENGGPKMDEESQATLHNTNVSISYNSLCVAAMLGINRIVLASSVNSVGMVFSKRPKFDYVPIDEKHPFRPEDAYSISKYVCEIQADAFVRRHPDMRVASMRFHFVAPMEGISAAKMHEYMGAWKDLWGWVSADATADACLKGLTAPTSTFAIGHETFFIVAGTHCQQGDSMTLLKSKFPEITDIRKPLHGNDGFFDTSKAKRMLGWEEEGFPWRP